MLTLLLLACNAPPTDTGEPVDRPLDDAIACQLDPGRMKATIDVLADDRTGGRIPGSIGHIEARDYLVQELSRIGLSPFDDDGDFILPYANEPIDGRYQLLADGTVAPHATDTGYDLVGLLPGSDPDLADEYLVVMAHYDHLGVTEDGEIFNGAFDNAGGVAIALEVARVLVANDAAPARSVIFLLTDDEESGLDGSAAWLESRLVPAEDVVMAISADPLGRALLPDYAPMILIGLERSPALEERVRALADIARKPLVFMNRDVIPIFASDQDEFYGWETGIPAAWFTNLGFTWYHTTGDTAETIDYDQLLGDADFLAQLLTELGSDGERYDFIGPVDPAGAAAADAISLFEGVLGSDYPNTSQREYAEGVVAQLEEVVAADDDSVLDDPDTFYLSALAFLMYNLGQDHPGVVPPPWPEGAGCD